MAFLSRLYRPSSRSPSRAPRDERGSHPILSVFELERLLYTGKTACNHADEKRLSRTAFPVLWDTFSALRCPLCCACRDIASNRRELLQLRITHVLNASHCRWRGGADYYEGTGIRYLGIEAHDSPSFDMSPYFYPAADFIHQALSEGPRARDPGKQGWFQAGMVSPHGIALMDGIAPGWDHPNGISLWDDPNGVPSWDDLIGVPWME
ncbi:hypothetical protein DV515_00017841 [Chloebia gouldiae]|uniref:Dual specificity protein phosphatase n=1 Tax=Chloebia gouldiae TaxID=44316 RepID=A0A3L8Q9G3_CHLGU|nr:hypothetical protein DV515_00017841 [Chloebia gouldiae]